MPDSWRLPTARLLPTAAIAVGLAAAGELDAAAATPEEVGRQLAQSREAWVEVKQQCGGNYEYVVRFESWTGFGHETTVIVRGNEVSERRFRSWPGRNQRAEGGAWVEDRGTIGTHDEGAKPKTLDELYDEAAAALAAEGPAEGREYVFRGDDDGLMLACYWIDTRIADDAPRHGVLLSRLNVEK